MSKNEVVKGSYIDGSTASVQLAAGSENASCFGKGTVSLDSIELPGCVHVDNLNSTLLSVGHICDQTKIVVFTANEAVILNMKGFSADAQHVVSIAKRNKTTRLHDRSGDLSDERRSLFTTSRPISMRANSTAISKDINLWHNRLGHAKENVLKSLPRTTLDISEI